MIQGELGAGICFFSLELSFRGISSWACLAHKSSYSLRILLFRGGFITIKPSKLRVFLNELLPVLSQLLLLSLVVLVKVVNLLDLIPVRIIYQLFLKRRLLGGNVGLLRLFNRSFQGRIYLWLNRGIRDNLSSWSLD
jgi:hypothetical protein